MMTMVLKEVKRQLWVQGNIDANVRYILKGVTQYKTEGEPTLVDAKELKERLISLLDGDRTQWNELASNVVTTMTTIYERV